MADAQYGAISSASSLVNTVLPVIGGIGIDYWGATYAAIICSTFIMVGALISAAGANTMHFGMIIGGRILMGFGSMGRLLRNVSADASHRIGADQAVCALVSGVASGAGDRS